MSRFFRQKSTSAMLCSAVYLQSCVAGEGTSPDGADVRKIENVNVAGIEVVVYYANETPGGSDLFKSRLENIKNGAMKAEQSVANLSGASLALKNLVEGFQKDIETFGAQSEKESRELEAELCKFKDVRSPPRWLFVFTNQLARREKFRVCINNGNQIMVEERDFPVNLENEQQKDFRINSMPLSTQSGFSHALRQVEETLIEKKIQRYIDYVSLFLKSHVASDKLLVPKHVYPHDFGSSAADVQELSFVAAALALRDIRIVDFEYNGRRLGLFASGKSNLEDMMVSVDGTSKRDVNLASIKFGDVMMDSTAPVSSLKIADLRLGANQIVTDPILADVSIGDLNYNGVPLTDYLGAVNAAAVRSAGFVKSPVDVGIDVDRFSQILTDSELPWSVVVVDSCDSKVSKSLRVNLQQSLANRNWGRVGEVVFFSNDLGLRYETLSFRSMSLRKSFGAALRLKFSPPIP